MVRALQESPARLCPDWEEVRMRRAGELAERGDARVVCAARGVGPLLERDYWAVMDGAQCTPGQVGARLREQFEEFAPPETAVFRRLGSDRGPLEVGDELGIKIALLGSC